MAAYKRTHPQCEVPGCPTPTHSCDHIIPLAEGGNRYAHGNLMALCRSHHSEKTTQDALRGKTRAR
jgi:5-methylcytosine-specific restriction endonuclease McrA